MSRKHEKNYKPPYTIFQGRKGLILKVSIPGRKPLYINLDRIIKERKIRGEKKERKREEQIINLREELYEIMELYTKAMNNNFNEIKNLMVRMISMGEKIEKSLNELARRLDELRDMLRDEVRISLSRAREELEADYALMLNRIIKAYMEGKISHEKS